MISLQRRCKKHRQNQVFSIRGGLTFEKITPEILFYGTSGRDFMLFGVLPDSNNLNNNIVIPFNLPYEDVRGFRDGRSSVRDANGKWGVIDIQGNLIVPCENNNIVL